MRLCGGSRGHLRRERPLLAACHLGGSALALQMSPSDGRRRSSVHCRDPSPRLSGRQWMMLRSSSRRAVRRLHRGHSPARLHPQRSWQRTRTGDPQEAGAQQEGQQPRKKLRLLSAAEVRLRDENKAGSGPPEPVLRLVEPGERLTRTPIPSPATPYLQSWTRTLPDGRTLRVLNRVPRPPRYLATEPRQPLP